VGKKAERLAWDVIAAAQQHAGITKAAGGTAAVHAVVLPLAEVIVKQNKAIQRTTREIRKNAKALRRMGVTQPVPTARGMVPFRSQEWRTALAPAAGLQTPRNGFSHDPDDDDGPSDAGPWDDRKGLS
jgi:hypothetical protein